jgi:hypothetical protein
MKQQDFSKDQFSTATDRKWYSPPPPTLAGNNDSITLTSGTIAIALSIHGKGEKVGNTHAMVVTKSLTGGTAYCDLLAEQFPHL